MNYYLAIYYLKLNSYDYAMSLCPTIKNIKKRNSVKLLINYMKGESINNYSRKGVINMARCLYDYKCCEELLQSDFNECKKKGYLMVDFYPLIIEYLQLNDNIEKSDFISNKVLKELERSKDLFLRKYFTNQAWIISSTNAKYKFFFETYANFLGKE